MKWRTLFHPPDWRIHTSGEYVLHRVCQGDTALGYAVIELRTLGIFPTNREAREVAELASRVVAKEETEG